MPVSDDEDADGLADVELDDEAAGEEDDDADAGGVVVLAESLDVVVSPPHAVSAREAAAMDNVATIL